MKLTGVTALILLIIGVSSDPVDDLNYATRIFAAKLYTELIRNRQNPNFIFSPITIQTIMALFSSASRYENQEAIQQIRNTLNLPWGEYHRQAGFKQVLEGLNQADNDFKVFLATKMYLKSGYCLQNWYQNIALNVYRSEIETVNFYDKLTTSQKINQWVAKETHNRITHFIGSYNLSGTAENLMINTVYLMGHWDHQFDQSDNTIKTFEGLIGPRPVTMMNTEHVYDYFEDNNAQYLKLEMLRDGGGAEMIFVLPYKRIGLSQLESNVPDLLGSKPFKPMVVNVTLPKFSIGSAIKLKPLLKKLGMRRAFEHGIALEGVRYPGDPLSRITDLLQKTFIAVDESGVNAINGILYDSYGDYFLYDKRNFIADHPFLFYLTVDDAILFAGRVMQV